MTLTFKVTIKVIKRTEYHMWEFFKFLKECKQRKNIWIQLLLQVKWSLESRFFYTVIHIAGLSEVWHRSVGLVDLILVVFHEQN